MPARDRGSRDRGAGSPAALAPNWRQVLLADAALGLMVAVAGILMVVLADAPAGWVPATLGVVYVFAIVGRYRIWRTRREEAGLDV
jgi:hypothetical protein